MSPTRRDTFRLLIGGACAAALPAGKVAAAIPASTDATAVEVILTDWRHAVAAEVGPLGYETQVNTDSSFGAFGIDTGADSFRMWGYADESRGETLICFGSYGQPTDELMADLARAFVAEAHRRAT